MTEIKSFLDYEGLQLYTNKMMAWEADELTKFEYQIATLLPDPYLGAGTEENPTKQPRFIYLHKKNTDDTFYTLYMYVLNLGDNPDYPKTQYPYKLEEIGTLELDLDGYYTAKDIDDLLEKYVSLENTVWQDLAANWETHKGNYSKLAARVKVLEERADDHLGDISGLDADVKSLSLRIAEIEEGGVGGSCSCTSIDQALINGLFVD